MKYKTMVTPERLKSLLFSTFLLQDCQNVENTYDFYLPSHSCFVSFEVTLFLSDWLKGYMANEGDKMFVYSCNILSP